ncbi:MAG: hypothetical protein WD768_23275 [Phycisphaeraceae bacterium]
MSKPILPANTITITTYAELRRQISAFASCIYTFVIVIGTAGLGKTRVIKQAMADRKHLYLDNHATPFGLYEALYQHRDEPVILDDLDHIHRDPATLRLLKALCNTELVKNVSWLSKHRLIGDRPGQIPASFTTSSPVCLLTNQWSTANEHVKAVENRAIVLHFAASVQEVHQEVSRFNSQIRTVFDFIGQHQGLIRTPSIRQYVLGEQLRQANPETWRALLLESLGVDERIRMIALLTDDQAFPTEKARAQAFVDAGLGSQATYYRVKADLEKSQANQTASDRSDSESVETDNSRDHQPNL